MYEQKFATKYCIKDIHFVAVKPSVKRVICKFIGMFTKFVFFENVSACKKIM